jgi:hypothetical protein
MYEVPLSGRRSVKLRMYSTYPTIPGTVPTGIVVPCLSICLLVDVNWGENKERSDGQTLGLDVSKRDTAGPLPYGPNQPTTINSFAIPIVCSCGVDSVVNYS